MPALLPTPFVYFNIIEKGANYACHVSGPHNLAEHKITSRLFNNVMRKQSQKMLMLLLK